MDRLTETPENHAVGGAGKIHHRYYKRQYPAALLLFAETPRQAETGGGDSFLKVDHRTPASQAAYKSSHTGVTLGRPMPLLLKNHVGW
jgi:hypothetical protein